MRWPLVRVTVAERSMEPALRPGDWLLVRRTRRIRPGQIVLARHPGRPGMLIVKRAARRVDGGWWLTSDNPQAGAVDSRRFGAVPPALIVGRVLARYWRKTPFLCRTCRFYPERAVARVAGQVLPAHNRSGPVIRRGHSGLVAPWLSAESSAPAPLRPAG